MVAICSLSSAWLFFSQGLPPLTADLQQTVQMQNCISPSSWGWWGWNNSRKCLGEGYMHSKIYTWITESTKLVSPVEFWIFLGQSAPEVDDEYLAAVYLPSCAQKRNSKRFEYPDFTLRCVSLTSRREKQTWTSQFWKGLYLGFIVKYHIKVPEIKAV